MIYEVEYRRIEEGKMVIDANSEEQARKLLAIELACGTAPVSTFENVFINTAVLGASAV